MTSRPWKEGVNDFVTKVLKSVTTGGGDQKLSKIVRDVINRGPTTRIQKLTLRWFHNKTTTWSDQQNGDEFESKHFSWRKKKKIFLALFYSTANECRNLALIALHNLSSIVAYKSEDKNWPKKVLNETKLLRTYEGLWIWRAFKFTHYCDTSES